MQVLLEAGADENSADPRSQVPLHFAAKHGQIATLQMLLYAWTGHKNRQLERNADASRSVTRI